jgi:hypothetical protein
MKHLIAEITKKVAEIEHCQFASLTYLTKKSKELARFTVLVGFSYHKAVEKSITELEILIAENEALAADNPDKWNAATIQAANEMMASFKKTLAAHAVGEQNADYTKKGQYIHIANGVNVNTTDNTIQLFGLVQSKITLVAGEYPPVKSSPVTIAKGKLKKLLTIGKFREFAVDESQVASVRVNGNVLEMERETLV